MQRKLLASFRGDAVVYCTVLLFYVLMILLRISQCGFNISGLITVGSVHLQSAAHGVIGHGVVVYKHNPGYDGFAYYAVAADPFMIHPQLRDPFRYQRILYPALAWALSLGHHAWQPITLALANLIAVIVAAGATLRLLRLKNASVNPWWTVAATCNPSLIIGVQYDLAEPVLLAACLSGLYFYLARRLGLASICFALGLLTREVAILFLLPLFITELWQRRPTWAGVLALSIVPYVMWELFVRARLGSTGIAGSGDNVSVPLRGLVTALASSPQASFMQMLIHQSSTVIVVAYVLLVVAVASTVFVRRQSVIVGALWVHGAAALCGGAAIWAGFQGFARVFGGMYPLVILGYVQARSRWLGLVVLATILLAPFTVVRMAILNAHVGYFVTR